MRQPVIFVSHGAPSLIIDNTPARDFLRKFGAELDRPRAILVVSAHWETAVPTVSTARQPETIYDFGGFAPVLYTMRHPAPGAPDVAGEVALALSAAGFPVARTDRGLDHGAWIPLKLMNPEADIPVLQLSILHGGTPEQHLRMGAALAPLRDKGVLILASGSITHDLKSFFVGRPGLDDPAPDWVAAFGDWAAERVEAGDLDALLDYRAQGPYAARNHPTEDHILPLHVALGAAAGDKGRRIHRSHAYAVIQMDAYAFGLLKSAA